MSHHQPVAQQVPRLPRDESGNQAQRARENRAHVRRLLSEHQPGLARALEAAVWDLSDGRDDLTVNDGLDDLAAFLMHRTADAGTTEEERFRTFALVAAYQEGDDPPAIETAMREAAVKFTSHPGYRDEWQPALTPRERGTAHRAN